MDVGLPSARSLTVIERTSTTDDLEEPTVSYYISSIAPERKSAQYFAELARGHWGGCEIRNHWIRDACMREDNTRSKNHNLNCALSALRVCLIVLKTQFYTALSWPDIQERSQHDLNIPYLLISNHRAK